jgi:putative transposase
MLAYKATWNGGTLITADRWFPSSKTCSACGAAKATLSLSERTFRCEACGLVLDRDVNAARNLLQLAASGAESLNASGATVRPGPAGHVAVKLEPGTAQAGKTGTVPAQAGLRHERAIERSTVTVSESTRTPRTTPATGIT